MKWVSFRGPLALALAFLGLAYGGLLAWSHLGGRSTAPAELFVSGQRHSGDAPLPVLWRAPDFDFEDQEGRRVSCSKLAGRVWIADFIFTRCTSICPVLTAKMVQLQRMLPSADLRFVSISVDPEHDTREVLSAYARRWNASESRWSLLRTAPESLRAVAAGMHVTVLPGDGDVMHSSVLLLVDRAGAVRGAYDTDEQALATLAEDARSLLEENPALAPGAAGADSLSGAQLYSQLGCAGCHDQPAVAPPLAGLPGRPVKLASGETVFASDDYLRESIVMPGARVVAGYPATMPSYRSQLDEAQLARLVSHLHGLAPDSHEAAPTATVVEEERTVALVNDPVCQMKVRADKHSPHFSYGGKDPLLL